MSILICGGAGFIGSHTVVELLQKGQSVVIADNFSNSVPAILDGIQAIVGQSLQFELLDLSDPQSCKTCFDRHPDIDSVIHFAASKAVGESVDQPLLYYRNNLNSLLCVLQEMSHRQISRIVFSSSCTVYGQPSQLPVNEKAPLQKAESPYGNTKQISEDILTDCAKAYGISCVALRYFNPIGAHPSALIGEWPLGKPNNLMPFITQTAAGIREELQVFGNNYDTPDGTCIRDYIHVVDLALAHLSALDYLDAHPECRFEAFNIGTGRGYSVLEVIESFKRTTGQALNYRMVDRRPGDIEQIWANPSLAHERLGWSAIHSLDEMTLSAWQWQQQCIKMRS